MAPTIGISVDHRRRNRCLESLQANVNRLKAYKANLVVFPRKSSAPKAGDSPAEDLTAVEQHTGVVMPIQKTATPMEFSPVTEDMKVRIPCSVYLWNLFTYCLPTSLFAGCVRYVGHHADFPESSILCTVVFLKPLRPPSTHS